MMAWWKLPLGFALVAALALGSVLVPVLAIAFVFFGPVDYAQRYLHFSALSKERLIQEAKVYIRDRAGGDQMACLYVVECDGENARLELVSDISGWDFQAAKDRIWRRRFSNYCPGRTTNFGLHLIPRAGHMPEMDDTSHARWSFFNDRFIPQASNFQSGSFSDQPWEQCTPERAIVR
jgi:hypothetical protein